MLSVAEYVTAFVPSAGDGRAPLPIRARTTPWTHRDRQRDSPRDSVSSCSSAICWEAGRKLAKALRFKLTIESTPRRLHWAGRGPPLALDHVAPGGRCPRRSWGGSLLMQDPRRRGALTLDRFPAQAAILAARHCRRDSVCLAASVTPGAADHASGKAHSSRGDSLEVRLGFRG